MPAFFLVTALGEGQLGRLPDHPDWRAQTHTRKIFNGKFKSCYDSPRDRALVQTFRGSSEFRGGAGLSLPRTGRKGLEEQAAIGNAKRDREGIPGGRDSGSKG